MEEKILAIIKKIRTIYRFTEYKEIVNNAASIHISEVGGQLQLFSITFNNWDSIIFCPTCIIFEPEHGNRKTLAEFKNIEEFLKDEQE